MFRLFFYSALGWRQKNSLKREFFDDRRSFVIEREAR